MSFFREAYYDKHEQERLREEKRIEALREARRRGLTSLHETGGIRGVSHDVLNDQIDDRKNRFLSEQESRAVDALEERSIIDRVTMMNDDSEKLRRQKALEYRRELEEQMANAHLRTTYYLNNKETLRGAPVPPLNEDIVLGPSSMQVFDGEDSYRSERTRLMKEQVWIDYRISS